MLTSQASRSQVRNDNDAKKEPNIFRHVKLFPEKSICFTWERVSGSYSRSGLQRVQGPCGLGFGDFACVVHHHGGGSWAGVSWLPWKGG